MNDPWNISPELESIKSKLVQLGAGDHTGMFLSIIKTAASLKERMKALEKRRGKIKDALNFAPDPSVIELIPNLPEIYRQRF